MKLTFALISVLQLTLFAQSSPPPLPSNDLGTPLVSYRAFFHHIQYLERTANGVSAQEATELRSLHQNKIGLSDAQAMAMKQMAAAHVSAVDALDQQANAIIQAQRAQFPGGKIPRGAKPPAPSPRLAQLTQERDNLTVAHVRALQGSLGASYAKLDAYVAKSFAEHNAVVPPGPRPPMPPTPQRGVN